MRPHPLAEFSLDPPIKVVRNLPPDFDATDFNDTHCILPLLPSIPLPIFCSPSAVNTRRKQISKDQPDASLMKNSGQSYANEEFSEYSVSTGTHSRFPATQTALGCFLGSNASEIFQILVTYRFVPPLESA